jgi:hypothetical protein
MAGELGLASLAPQRGSEALRAIGWSIRKPRPSNPKATTPAQQEAFKKDSPKSSPRKRRRARAASPTRAT